MAISFPAGQVSGATGVSSVSHVWPFGPSQGVFLILLHQRVINAVPNVPTMTMNGAATVRIGSSIHVGPGTARHRLSVFRAPTYAAGAQNNTMVITFGGQTQDNVVYHWLAVEGTVLVSPNCRQLVFAEATNAASVTTTMGGAISSASRCLAAAQAERDGDPLGPSLVLAAGEPDWVVQLSYGSDPVGAVTVKDTTSYDASVVLEPVPSPADMLASIMEWTEQSIDAATSNEPVLRTSGSSTTDGTSFVTALVSPTEHSLLLLGVEVAGATADTDTMSIDGLGLTWTQAAVVGYQDSGGTKHRLRLFRAQEASAAGTIAITTSGTSTACAWSLVEVINVPTGMSGDLLVNVQTSSGNGLERRTLSTLPLTDGDRVRIGIVGLAPAAVTYNISGLTQLAALSYATPPGGLYAGWTNEDQKVDVELDAGESAGIGIITAEVVFRRWPRNLGNGAA